MNLSARHITPLDILALILFLGASFPMAVKAVQPAFGPYQPQAIDLTMPAQLTVLHEVEMSPKAQVAYDEWLIKKGYFGAFAVGDDGGFGWSDNHMTADFANQSALEFAQNCGCLPRLYGPSGSQGFCRHKLGVIWLGMVA